MKRIFALTVAMLAVLFVLALPAYAGEVDTAPMTEAVTEEVTEAVTEEISAVETEAVTSAETETETAVPFDEWLYGLLQEASPEQMDMIEEIVLGGVGALDKLGIKGFDRIRLWVEHNMATVMVAALIVALVCFFAAEIIVKKKLSDKADLVNNNAVEIYEKGQEAIAEARKITEEATKAMERVLAITEQERAEHVWELDKSTKVNAALCETVHFLLQCSDLPVNKRDEAEAIYRKAQEAMSHDEADEA